MLYELGSRAQGSAAAEEGALLWRHLCLLCSASICLDGRRHRRIRRPALITPPRRNDTQEEEGTEYLQFSCPLTEMYSVMFDVPSGLLFWRVPLRKGANGSIVLQGGQIISEKNGL